MDLVYNVIFRPETENGFTATVPSLPGCVTYGKTLTEARRMAEDAIFAYLESLRKHRQPLPNDEAVYVTAVRLQTKKRRARAYA